MPKTLRTSTHLVLAVLLAACGGDKGTTQPPAPVAAVSITSANVSLEIGDTTRLTAVVKDASGNVLTNRPITWTSSDTTRARISSSGLITGIAVGSTSVMATAEAKTATVDAAVRPYSADFSIDAAQWTQGVQAADGTIPLILNGNAAVLNVLVSSNRTMTRTTQFVLRLFDGNGTLYRTDTATTIVGTGAPKIWSTPTLQFLVPASALKPAMAWQLVRDPRASMPDTTPANDILPRTGTTTIATRSVPVLKLRFVPITLAAHGSITGQVSNAAVPLYLQTLRSIHPVGEIQVNVGAPMVTQASFGTPPAGGASAFWQQVLRELDLARVASATSDEHWIGVVAPPVGFNNTAFGGFGYIPPDAAATGIGTRTSVLVNVGWFNNPTQSRDLVAHELGHNFGRSHAPCGGAGSPIDASFPSNDGRISTFGHDVYSWGAGVTTRATTIDQAVGDVMGYCFPVWSSEYTYRAVMQFRGGGVIAQTPESPAVAERVLAVQGVINKSGAAADSWREVVLARHVPQDSGPHVLEGVDANGRVLFTQSFATLRLDHSDDQPFTVLVPMSAWRAADVAKMRVH